MNSKGLLKAIAVLLSVSVLFTGATFGTFSAYSEEPTGGQHSEVQQNDDEKGDAEAPTKPATEPTTVSQQQREEAEQALKNQMDQLAKDLENAEQRLLELGAQSKETEEYVNALDEKIGYLNEQLTILDNSIMTYQEDIDALQLDIDTNQAETDVLQAAVDQSQALLNSLRDEFQRKYDSYCVRARAIYISGNLSIFATLLLSDDISSFLTRYEMIKAVSKSDAELLSDIEEQTKLIMENEQQLTEEKAVLDAMKNKLISQRDQLSKKQSRLTSAQEESAAKKVILAADRAESDELLAALNAKNGMYTEFRNEDKALLDAVENEIDMLIKGLKNPDDVTLATTSDRNDITVPAYEHSDVYNNSDAVLNMTYPAPGNYTVSCAFGRYSNGSPHNGTDFPCVTGSKIVAAQSGIVIKVQRLKHSYGNYVMVYHGTDSSGRTVVTLYAHNSEILVSPGDTVAKGQQIAKSGSTGNSTGPHCHFEIRLDNKAVNPKNYLSK